MGVWRIGDMSPKTLGRDLSRNPSFQALRKWSESVFRPLFGEISRITDLSCSPSGSCLVFSGQIREGLDHPAQSRVWMLDLERRVTREVVVPGTRSVWSPGWSPDGARLAVLATGAAGVAEPWIVGVDPPSPAIRLAYGEGAVEAVTWCTDNRRLLVRVAPFGADLAGASGSSRVPGGSETGESWLPEIDSGSAAADCRYLSVVDRHTGVVERVSPPGLNVWEAAWCGTDRVVAVGSDDPGEDSWYDARVVVIDLPAGQVRTLYKPALKDGGPMQIGLPAVSPHGESVAVVEGRCSDRGVVAGDVRVVDVESGAVSRPRAGMDVSAVSWRDNRTVVVTGLDGIDCVVADLHLPAERVVRLWSDSAFLGGQDWLPTATPAGNGKTYVVRETYEHPAMVVCVSNGAGTTVFRVAVDDVSIGDQEPVTWRSSDGVEVHGLLTRPPQGSAPYPLVVSVHGGPVSATTRQWALRPGGLAHLVAQGYAVFSPNPRGSVGRGSEFVEALRGDMGGVDTADVLSGVDSLVAAGVADPRRVGVIGGSYGGFLSAWLVGHDRRFAAAVVVAPITDWASFQLTSNIAAFGDLFLEPRTAELRSPLAYVDQVRTPVLTIVGEQDACTPPAQGIMWHRALMRSGYVPSTLVRYPLLGHVPRDYPEMLDFDARVLDWFVTHMPAGPGAEPGSASAIGGMKTVTPG